MNPLTSKKRLKTMPTNPILEALNEDGSMDMKLLKKIARGCLEGLKEKHGEGKFLGNFRPAQILYAEIDGKIKIKFVEPEVEPMLNDCRISELIWMAPEMLKKDSKPTAASDVFSLGLLFFFMLTKRGSPLDINFKFLNGEIQYRMIIDSQLLDTLTKDADSILFVDLIKRMIKKNPDQRQTSEDLIDHAALKNDKEWLEIVQLMAGKCFSGDKCINEYLVQIIDKKEVHMKGSLAEDSAEWKELIAEVAKLSVKPNLKACSSLLMIFSEQRHHGLLQPIMAALPNFFPHLYNIYREDLPKEEERSSREIFEHFNDEANSLGTGSNHTRVYRGKFQRRPIAIKRVVKDLAKIVDREISIMLQTDRHPNILKYIAREDTEDFIYIGTELCECNLATFIKDQNRRQKMSTKSIFEQTAEGLRHLHQLSIIHRDVKPENILISNDNGAYSVKLADFGISKDLSATTLSTLNAPGTLAWIAPEVVKNGHTKTSDIFSLGSVFYFITFDGTILSKELNMSYKDIKLKLKEKQEMINDQGNNKKILQMEMVTTLLNIKPEARPSVEKVLHHAFFWEDKRCLEFILDIRKKFDVLDTRFVKKIKDGMEYQKVLKEMLIARQLKVTLDSDKLVGHNGWKAKLDESLAEEFTGDYDKECVSDLLKAMRNKWMHLIELKDVVRDLFGNGSEGEYLRYFTAKFPRLLVHCYNAVEKEGKELLIEYFHDDASAQAPTIPIRIKSAETKFIINCKDDIAFSDMDNNSLDIIVICNSSRLFIEQNKSFNNFLHRNGSNVTHLEFFLGSLTFESLDKILQKLPNIQEIRFHGVEYGPSKAVLETIFLNPVQSVLWSAESSKLLKAFLECQTMQKLKVMDNNVTFEEILQKYASLEELKVGVSDMYPVSDQQKATSTIHQLKVLRITLFTKNEQIYKQVISSIIKQNILQQFHFNSFDNNSFSQSLYKPLAVHICQLERLNILMIDDEKLLKEVAAFVANSRVANTRLQEFTSRLSHFKSLPSSFLAYFTNLKQLVINCYEAEETKVADLISYMNKTQLTSIRLWNLSSACSLLLQKLQVHSLKILEIEIRNKVPVFDILREFLPRHPNITQFEIKFKYDYDEPKSLKLIPMILATLTKLERLEVWNHSKITAKDIKQITALETLKFWRINDHKSETFYKT